MIGMILQTELDLVQQTIIMQSVPNLQGAYYIPAHLTAEELEQMTDDIQNTLDFAPISSSSNSRRVVHFGYEYNYKAINLTPTDPIPSFYSALINKDRLKAYGINFEKGFDQLIVNEYKPGQRITAHVDSKIFRNGIICLTVFVDHRSASQARPDGGNVSTQVPVVFTKGTERIELTPEHGSLYIISGPARYEWKHELVNPSNSKCTRYSFTYRRSV